MKVPRAENSADILTHPTTGEEMAAGLDLMGVRRELAVGPAGGRKSPHWLRGGGVQRYLAFSMFLHSNPRQVEPEVPKPFGQDACCGQPAHWGKRQRTGAETLQDPHPPTNVTNGYVTQSLFVCSSFVCQQLYSASVLFQRSYTLMMTHLLWLKKHNIRTSTFAWWRSYSIREFVRKQ